MDIEFHLFYVLGCKIIWAILVLGMLSWGLLGGTGNWGFAGGDWVAVEGGIKGWAVAGIIGRMASVMERRNRRFTLIIFFCAELLIIISMIFCLFGYLF